MKIKYSRVLRKLRNYVAIIGVAVVAYGSFLSFTLKYSHAPLKKSDLEGLRAVSPKVENK